MTPIGHSPWSTLTALLAGQATTDRLDELPDEVDPTTLARATAGIGMTAHSSFDPAADLAERAARQALTDAGIEPNSPRARQTDFVIASSKGAIGSLIDPTAHHRQAEVVTQSPHGYLASHVQRRLGLGRTSAPVAACATSLAALRLAAQSIDAGESERTVVVAVESALHPMFVHSYHRLGVLAPASPPTAHRAKPLDQNRTGFTLNECAAAVVLERAGDLDSNRRPWARLVRTACTTEPFDLIRAPAQFKALQRAAQQVVQDEERIALLQPHATGTIDNDERELAALAQALGDRTASTPIYASKGAIGHGLGAAGLVNVVLGCLFGRAGKRPPMPWLTSPIQTDFLLTAEAQPIERGLHVCVAAGFGGHVGAVSFET